MHNSTSNITQIIPEDNSRQALLLLIFAIIMFLIRTVPIYHKIFTDWPGAYGNFINFSADDAVYHMRLVHNTIHHFPWRVFFDPFTHFPFGNQIHFGPLFTLIIAAAVLIVGLGHPSAELVNIVGAYVPPVMGALCLIPTYFIARKLCGKTAAILAALILTFLPGEFLQRSTLGFTDHHVAEVLFSTLTCVFLIYALNAAKTFKFTFKNLLWKSNRITLVHSLLAGISFGLFVLVWPAALMFGVIFLLFFIAQLLIDHFHNKNTEYLLLLAITLYSIPALMVLPYALMNPNLSLMYYSLTQPLLFIAMAIIFATCYTSHLIFKRNRITKELLSLGIAALFILIVLVIRYNAPTLYTIMQDSCKMLFEPSPGMTTVTEIRPSILAINSNHLSIARFWLNYFWALPLTVIGLGYLSYRAHKNLKPAEVFLLTWTIAIVLAACAQCRFNYYLAINVAIIAGCYGFYPLMELLSSLNPKGKSEKLLQKIALYTIFCVFTILIINPIIMFAFDKTWSSGVQITRERYNAYIWLKTHTPDPQGKIIDKSFDYTAGYYPIPKNPSANYNYPKSSYGVMSWWDLGHQFTYIAERIPNVNTFQQGILEYNNTAGGAPFFTSTSEAKAIKNLDTVGSRYIFIDHSMAVDLKGIGIWNGNIENWETSLKTKIILPEKQYQLEIPIDSKKFSQSMINRLYYNDTNGLQHFRLIYESDGDYTTIIRRAIFKPQFHVDKMQVHFQNHNTASVEATAINRIYWANKEKTVLAYNARPPVKQIKIFEKVKGAVIQGTAPKNINNHTKVNLTLNLKTKFNRIFTYRQTTTVNNGKYKFVVPYPTTAMHGDGYSYDIKPLGDYQIQIGTKKIEVSVPEKAIMLGKRISIY